MTMGTDEWSFKPGDFFALPIFDSPDWYHLYDNVVRYGVNKCVQLNYPAENRKQPILSEVEIDQTYIFFNTKSLGLNGKIGFLGFSQKHPETMGVFINTEGMILEIELLFFEEDVVGYLQKVDDDE